MIFEESEKIELKSIFTPELKKEVIAFSNTNGGTIYVGIADDGQVLGLEDVDSTSLQISNAIRQGIKPDVSIFTQQEIMRVDGKDIIKIHISEGTRKPYYLSDKGIKSSGVYVRQGTSSTQASEDAIRTMIKQSDGDVYEAYTSLNQDLHFNSIAAEMVLRDLEFTPIQQKSLGLINQDEDFTNLGLIVSEECKHSIKIAIFQGDDKTEFKDRKEINGSIFTQLAEAFKFINLYNKTQASFDGLLRIDKRDYPLPAIREALLNALIHRDYSLSGSISINIYSNRIEFISLGGLVSGLSIEAAMAGVSQPRNARLAALFYRMKLIESYGIGLGKIIDSYKSSLIKPTINPIPGAFVVTLPNCNETVQSLSAHQQAIVQYLKHSKSITRADTEHLLNIKFTRSNAILKEMAQQGIITKVGAGRNTHYVLP